MKVNNMKTYIALLRGINVGKQRRVEMKRLKALFESWGYTKVFTYINSGNVIFESDQKRTDIRKKTETNLKKEFGFDIPTLVKTEQEIKNIANALPKEWQNDSTQRSDVAYLFPEIDSKKTLHKLPIKKEYIEVRYIKGAICWNINRKNYNKSQLNKLIGHKIYQLMTIRNINTARNLTRQNKYFVRKGYI
jgi:uncharacterized protein (DUF1697 family)